MQVRDDRVDPNATFVEREFLVTRAALASGLAGVTIAKILPGVKFKVLRVEAWAEAAVANVSVDVKIGATSALAAAVVPGAGAADPAAATLSATAANQQGSATAALSVVVTTDGTGTATDLVVRVVWRPIAFHDET